MIVNKFDTLLVIIILILIALNYFMYIFNKPELNYDDLIDKIKKIEMQNRELENLIQKNNSEIKLPYENIEKLKRLEDEEKNNIRNHNIDYSINLLKSILSTKDNNGN